MERKRLLARIGESLCAHVPHNLRDFETILGARLLKVHYGDPAFHFEVWFHENKGLVEIAYHGEGPARSNNLLMQRLAANLIPIKESLGPTVELEPWVRSWVRLYRMLPAEQGDTDLEERLIKALAGMIVVVQPLVADVARVGV